MLFKACAEGRYEAGKTYERPVNFVFVNALRCIPLTPGVAPPRALWEIRPEGKIIRAGDTVTGQKTTAVRMLTSEERCAAWTGVLVRETGAQIWYRNGQLHREGDLPAMTHRNGDQSWYCNG